MNNFWKNRCQNNCCNNIIPIPGPIGPTGQAATIAIGTTTNGEPGTNAIVTNSGTSNNAVLNFVIPKGENGDSATISIGSTTTLPSGSPATVTNVGTSSNAILNFGIPTSSNEPQETLSGSFISRNSQSLTSINDSINLPITLNNNGITINNSEILITKTAKYLINYGFHSNNAENIVGIYINGINNENTNLETTPNNFNQAASIILNLNNNDVITLGAINPTLDNPLILKSNTINAYITIMSIS